MVQVAPIHHSHVSWPIKISRTVFEKGHPMNISVKLFQNLKPAVSEKIFYECLHVCIVHVKTHKTG